jgi:long-chain acyl-CoA synthetase
MGLHLPLSLGIRLEMLPDYEPHKFADNIYKHKTAHAVAGPADWSNFLENNKVSKRDYSFLKTLGSGSDKIDTTKRHEIDKILSNCGVKFGVMEGYGMSEVGSAAVTNLPKYIVDDSVGIPLTKMNISIVDENNNELTYNETGEICFSGETMMKEYLNNVEETQNIITIGSDGRRWLHSGDIGYMDENGNIFLQGRIKRIIVRYDGFKIFPLEVENIIMKSGVVENCCVVGIPNKEKGSGAMPVAAVVLKENYNNIEYCISCINNICNEQLTERYRPTDIMILDELPLTDVGKVDYRKLTNDISCKSNKSKTLKK